MQTSKQVPDERCVSTKPKAVQNNTNTSSFPHPTPYPHPGAVPKRPTHYRISDQASGAVVNPCANTASADQGISRAKTAGNITKTNGEQGIAPDVALTCQTGTVSIFCELLL